MTSVSRPTKLDTSSGRLCASSELFRVRRGREFGVQALNLELEHLFGSPQVLQVMVSQIT